MNVNLNVKWIKGESAVSEQIIDTFTRRAADAVSRRTSLVVLAGTALTAVTATPSAARGGRKGKKRKKRNDGDSNAIGPLAQARCASQADQCRAIFTDLCQDAQCLSRIFCCNPLATCDADGALACIFADI
jgi:hypothetical protein